MVLIGEKVQVEKYKIPKWKKNFTNGLLMLYKMEKEYNMTM
jgi:hypothetical protein